MSLLIFTQDLALNFQGYIVMVISNHRIIQVEECENLI